MKYCLTLIITAAWLIAWTPASYAAPPRVKVGVVFDGPDARQEEFFDAAFDEIVALSNRDAELVVEDAHRVEGGGDPMRVAAGLERLLADSDVGLVITVGAISSHIAASRGAPPPKPVFATLVFDPAFQGLPDDKGRSGVKNLNYLSVPYGVPRALGDVKRLFRASHVALLVHPALLASAPSLPAAIAAQGEAVGVKASVVALGRDPKETLAAIPEGVDAVIVSSAGTPEARASEAALLDALAGARLRTFSMLSLELIEDGAVAGVRLTRFGELLRRRLALNIQRTLMGDDPGTFPTTFDAGATRTMINLEAARRVGWSPTWPVLLDSEVIDARPDGEVRSLDLDATIDAARERNLDVKAGLLTRDAGTEEIALARARVLPDVSISAQARTIDADRARSGFGLNPQYQGSAIVQLSQVVYAEDAFAALDAQEHLQGDRDAQLAALELDVVEASALAFMDVLRARSLVRVQRANLETSRRNLEVSIVRERVGAVSRADVLRLRSEIAQSKKDLVGAFVSQSKAELQLTRLLDLPEDQPIEVTDEATSERGVFVRFAGLAKFLEDSKRVGIISAFMADEAARRAPELARLDASIAAQKRLVRRARVSFFAPDVVLTASLSTLFWSAGEGSASPDPTGGLAPGAPDAFNWEVGLGVSYPLFEGGSRFAEADQAELQLLSLQNQRRSIELQLRQRVRNALLDAVGSYAAIGLSQEQADAAAESLEIVSISYASGAVDINTLLDAQRTALNAQQAVVNAQYGFMNDAVRVERALGVFHTLASPAQREDFARRMRVYYEERAARETTPDTQEDSP